jgi:hypothetical protein
MGKKAFGSVIVLRSADKTTYGFPFGPVKEDKIPHFVRNDNNLSIEKEKEGAGKARAALPSTVLPALSFRTMQSAVRNPGFAEMFRSAQHDKGIERKNTKQFPASIVFNKTLNP